MDKTSSSSFRVTAPAEGPSLPAEPGGPCVQQPQRVKTRLLPVQAHDGTLDAERIGKGALATAIGQGSCFGLAFALLNHLRTHGKAYPFLNAGAGAVLPALTGYLTAPAQRAMFKALDYRSTQMPQDSLAHDAIPSFVLYGVYSAYGRSTVLPKPPPGTPAAGGVTLVVSMVGTGPGGAISEVTGQGGGGEGGPLPPRPRRRGPAAGRPPCRTTPRCTARASAAP